MTIESHLSVYALQVFHINDYERLFFENVLSKNASPDHLAIHGFFSIVPLTLVSETIDWLVSSDNAMMFGLPSKNQSVENAGAYFFDLYTLMPKLFQERFLSEKAELFLDEISNRFSSLTNERVLNFFSHADMILQLINHLPDSSCPSAYRGLLAYFKARLSNQPHRPLNELCSPDYPLGFLLLSLFGFTLTQLEFDFIMESVSFYVQDRLNHFCPQYAVEFLIHNLSNTILSSSNRSTYFLDSFYRSFAKYLLTERQYSLKDYRDWNDVISRELIPGIRRLRDINLADKLFEQLVSYLWCFSDNNFMTCSFEVFPLMKKMISILSDQENTYDFARVFFSSFFSHRFINIEAFKALIKLFIKNDSVLEAQSAYVSAFQANISRIDDIESLVMLLSCSWFSDSDYLRLMVHCENSFWPSCINDKTKSQDVYASIRSISNDSKKKSPRELDFFSKLIEFLCRPEFFSKIKKYAPDFETCVMRFVNHYPTAKGSIRIESSVHFNLAELFLINQQGSFVCQDTDRRRQAVTSLFSAAQINEYFASFVKSDIFNILARLDASTRDLLLSKSAAVAKAHMPTLVNVQSFGKYFEKIVIASLDSGSSIDWAYVYQVCHHNHEIWLKCFSSCNADWHIARGSGFWDWRLIQRLDSCDFKRLVKREKTLTLWLNHLPGQYRAEAELWLRPPSLDASSSSTLFSKPGAKRRKLNGLNESAELKPGQ